MSKTPLLNYLLTFVHYCEISVFCNSWNHCICDIFSCIINGSLRKCSLINITEQFTLVFPISSAEQLLKTVPSPSLQHSLFLLTCSTSCHFIHQAGQPFALARSHFPPLHASCLLPFTLPNRVNVKTAEGWDGREHTSTKPLKTVFGKHGNLIAILSSVTLIAAPLSQKRTY
jgi:hypothetical protein